MEDLSLVHLPVSAGRAEGPGGKILLGGFVWTSRASVSWLEWCLAKIRGHQEPQNVILLGNRVLTDIIKVRDEMCFLEWHGSAPVRARKGHSGT